MASEWKTVRLGDLTSWSSGGTPSKANPEFWNGDIPWISASSMKTPLLCNSELKITKSGLENGSRLAEPNSILLLVRGSELHNRIPVGVATRPVAFNQDVKALKVRGEMRSDYLFYWLLGNETMLLGKVEQTGIGAGKLDTEVLKNLPIALPPLAEQKAIAAVLGALDDKIELNRRMNATLEAMARALFQSWFVDFDPVRAKRDGQMPVAMDAATAALFPDAFQESSLGHIPSGWRVLKVGEFIERLSVGQKYEQKTVSPIGKVPVLDQGKSGVIGFHNSEPGVSATLEIPVAVFANHTCHMRLITFPFSAIQNVLPFVGSGVSTIWAYYASEGRLSFSEYKGHWPDFVIQESVVPPCELTDAYGRLVKPLVAQIRNNEEQSRTLATLRDTLLPKLLSGELRVSDVAFNYQDESD